MKNLNKILLGFFFIFSVVLFTQDESYGIIYTIRAPIEGIQEVPPNPSTGLGQVTGTYNDATFTLSFSLTFTGLSDPTTAAHFHAPAPPGVAAPVVIAFAGFPLGVTSGAYSNTYVLTAAQNAEIIGGLWYVNIHTSGSPGGEIRGQLEEGTLPVELSNFTATVSRNNVQLNWATAYESNNSGFNIERKSTTSTQWEKVGNVQGHGTTSEVSHYSFTDRANTGTYNYRLKQIDFNGNYEYFNLSNEVVIGVPGTYNLSQNYPNPFNPTTKIDYEIPFDGNVNITVYDMSGKEVANIVNEFKTAGLYTVDLNASNLSSGNYFYKLTSGNFVDTKKLTVIK